MTPRCGLVSVDRPAVEIRIAESALADLENIYSWYKEQGAPDSGARLVAQIIARIERLEDHPDIGRIVPE